MITAVLTRPSADSQRLAQILENQNISQITLPIMAVVPIPEAQRLPVPSLSDESVCIFVSANAVRFGLPELQQELDRVADTRVIAVGRKTRDTLAMAGIDAEIPERADSEGLLLMPALAAAEPAHVVIVKGEGGRDLLMKALTARGADVTEWSCYRRVWPDVSMSPLDAFEPDALVFQASSGEVLFRLSDLLTGASKADLFQSTVIVPSERVATLARESGWRRVLLAHDASDQGFLEALQSLL